MGVSYPIPILKHLQAKVRVAFLPDAVKETIKPEYTVVPFSKRHQLGKIPKQFDLVFAIHSLEYASCPTHFLQEIWKMLKPEGRLVVILPTQQSIWHNRLEVPARFLHKPRELKRLFEDSYLTLVKRRDFLFASPSLVDTSAFTCFFMKKVLKLFSLPFGGHMMILEAQKSVFPSISAARKQNCRIFLESSKSLIFLAFRQYFCYKNSEVSLGNT